ELIEVDAGGLQQVEHTVRVVLGAQLEVRDVYGDALDVDPYLAPGLQVADDLLHHLHAEFAADFGVFERQRKPGGKLRRVVPCDARERFESDDLPGCDPELGLIVRHGAVVLSGRAYRFEDSESALRVGQQRGLEHDHSIASQLLRPVEREIGSAENVAPGRGMIRETCDSDADRGFDAVAAVGYFSPNLVQ